MSRSPLPLLAPWDATVRTQVHHPSVLQNLPQQRTPTSITLPNDIQTTLVLFPNLHTLFYYLHSEALRYQIFTRPSPCILETQVPFFRHLLASRFFCSHDSFSQQQYDHVHVSWVRRSIGGRIPSYLFFTIFHPFTDAGWIRQFS